MFARFHRVRAFGLASVIAISVSSAPVRASEPPAWPTYGAELEAVELVAGDVIDLAAGTISGTSATGDDLMFGTWRDLGRPATDDPSGSDDVCSLTVKEPAGRYDPETGELDANVYANVQCTFVSPRIVFKVLFAGYDPPSGSFTESGLEIYCEESSQCLSARSYHRTWGACKGRFEHYGIGYGSYKTQDGVTHTLLGDGQHGPSKAGYSYSGYC